MPSSADLARWIEDVEREGITPLRLALAATLDDATGEAAALFRFVRADVLATVGRYDEAVALLESALAMASAEDDHHLRLRIRILLAQLYAETGRTPAALALRPALLVAAQTTEIPLESRVEAGQWAVRQGLLSVAPDDLLAELDALAGFDDELPAPVRAETQVLRALVQVRNADARAVDAALAAVDVISDAQFHVALLEVARLAHRLGDNGAAMLRCRQLLAQKPPSLLRDAARLCLGMAAWHSGRYEDAEAAFGAVLAAPDAHPADVAAARLNRVLLASARGTRPSADDVAVLFDAEAEEGPHAAVLHHARGQHLLLMESRPAEALRAFDTALTFLDEAGEPDHAVETRALRALALASLGRFEDAEQALAEAEAALGEASAQIHARFTQLRGYVSTLRIDAAPANAARDLARAEDDFAHAEAGFAITGRVEAVESVRLERARMAAERGDPARAIALIASAIEDPDERPAEWLRCAQAAHDAGARGAAIALCDAALAVRATLSPALCNTALLHRVVALAGIDGHRALAEATELIATGALSGNAATQVRVNRVGMLLDLGLTVPAADRAFLLSDECLANARWPDTVRAIRASLWLSLASPEHAKEALAEIDDDDQEGRRMLASRHLLLANAYLRTGQLDAARESHRRGSALMERVAESERPPLLMMSGSLQIGLGDHHGARASFTRSLALLDARGVRNTTHRAARIQLALTSVYLDDARPAAQASLEALLDEPDIATDGGSHAYALQVLGLVAGSPEHLEESARRFEALGDHGAASLSAELSGHLAQDHGDGPRARAQFERALRLTEAMRVDLEDGPDRAAMRRAASQRAVTLLDQCVRNGDDDAALAVPLRLHHPGGFIAAPPLDLAALSAVLPTDALAVEYLLGDAELIAVVMHRDGRALVRTPWSTDDAAALAQFDALGALLSGALSAGDAHGIERALATLSARLIHPLAAHLTGRSRLILGPGFEFAAVPFSALSLGPEGPSLLEAGVDCTRLLALARGIAHPGPVPTPASVLLLRGDDGLAGGPPLAFADEELTRIAARLQAAGRTVRACPAAAPLEALREALVSCDVIHYAGHVRRRARPDGPGYDTLAFPAGLAFAASELAGLVLARAPVVVLSGCESGDVLSGGSDVAGGLVRPLFAAGASAVVSSLWPVSDERTLRDMDRLYAAWLGGLPLDRALGAAARAGFHEAVRAGVSRTFALLHAANFHLYSLPR